MDPTLPPYLHLHTVPADPEHDPYDPSAPVSVPLGGGLSATACTGKTHHQPVSGAGLAALGCSATLLWQDAATAMLTVLGDLTAVHGTALRHREVSPGVREIAVIGDPFPAAGLIAHPLLAVPTHRILDALPRSTGTVPLFVTDDERLLLAPHSRPDVPCTGPVDASAGHCQALESVP